MEQESFADSQLLLVVVVELENCLKWVAWKARFWRRRAQLVDPLDGEDALRSATSASSVIDFPAMPASQLSSSADEPASEVNIACCAEMLRLAEQVSFVVDGVAMDAAAAEQDLASSGERIDALLIAI